MVIGVFARTGYAPGSQYDIGLVASLYEAQWTPGDICEKVQERALPWRGRRGLCKPTPTEHRQSGGDMTAHEITRVRPAQDASNGLLGSPSLNVDRPQFVLGTPT